MTLNEAKLICHTLSAPSKMPCYSFSTPARACKVGSKLRAVVGSVCEKCYAYRNFYNCPSTVNAMALRLAGLVHPQWVEAMVTLIDKNESTNYFRWHDSGDVQTIDHLDKICKVALALPDIKFWLPTREYDFVKKYFADNACPVNLTVRLSALMIDGPLPLKLAKQVGAVVSGVSTNKDEVTCPSSKQNNKCLRCRKCWDSPEPVIYGKH
jgi:hypothetical protein